MLCPSNPKMQPSLVTSQYTSYLVCVKQLPMSWLRSTTLEPQSPISESWLWLAEPAAAVGRLTGSGCPPTGWTTRGSFPTSGWTRTSAPLDRNKCCWWFLQGASKNVYFGRNYIWVKICRTGIWLKTWKHLKTWVTLPLSFTHSFNLSFTHSQHAEQLLFSCQKSLFITKVVHHGPRINISIWQETCAMWHMTCNMHRHEI